MIYIPIEVDLSDGRPATLIYSVSKKAAAFDQLILNGRTIEDEKEANKYVDTDFYLTDAIEHYDPSQDMDYVDLQIDFMKEEKK